MNARTTGTGEAVALTPWRVQQTVEELGDGGRRVHRLQIGRECRVIRALKLKAERVGTGEPCLNHRLNLSLRHAKKIDAMDTLDECLFDLLLRACLLDGDTICEHHLPLRLVSRAFRDGLSRVVARFFADYVEEQCLVAFPNLTELRVHCLEHPTDTGIARFSRLTRLDGSHQSLTEAAFSGLTRLTALSLWAPKSGGCLANLTALTSLSLGRNTQIRDDALVGLSRLVTLVLDHDSAITGASLSSRLTSLRLEGATLIRDETLSRLSALTSLSFDDNANITDAGVAGLTALTSLDLMRTRRVTERALWALTRLTKLGLYRNASISDRALAWFPCLTDLDLCNNERITDAAVSRLTGLTRLSLAENRLISGDALTGLTRLRALILANNEMVGDDALTVLTGLTELNLGDNHRVTDAGIAPLTALTDLDLSWNMTISESAVLHLTRLEALNRDCSGIWTLPALPRLDPRRCSAVPL